MQTFFLQQNMAAVSDGPPFSHCGAALHGKTSEDTLGLQTVENLPGRILQALQSAGSV